MNFGGRSEYSEDMFADTRMSFGDHLEDLRTHLIRAIAGFLVALLFSFIPGYWLLKFIAAPVEEEVNRFYDRRAERIAEDLKAGNSPYEKINQPREQLVEISPADLRKVLGLPDLQNGGSEDWVRIRQRIFPLDSAIITSEATRLVGRRAGLATLGPMEAFMAYLKVCFVCGLVVGSPWIFYQIWAFIAAGLYPHEKRLVNVYLPFCVLLFILGAVLCQFYIIPNALRGLLWFNYWLNLEPDMRFNEWLSFAILLPVLFGLSFQLPMVMFLLERVGIFTVETYIKKWRMAIFLIHFFAAVVTPVDILSMESLALGMCALYGLGILLCRLNPRPQEEEVEDEDSEALVEV
jgi:sec-independent protein translocase protein TatC